MPPKASGIKRTASSGGGPSSKKARFTEDAPQTRKIPTQPSAPDDGEGFADETLDDLEAPGNARRGKIKTEGYDSDSSDDGEGVVESRKKALRKKKKGDVDEDDVDMFGGEGGDDKDSGTEGMTKSKKDKFLNLGDIEGQEFGRNGGTDEDEDDEPEDEDDAARRAKKGMGYDVSSFNMKDEMEEGKFDEDGTFVRSFDPHQVHDRWMDGMDEREIKKARRSQKKIREKEEERQRKDADGLANKSKEELELQLLDYIRPGESVLQALGRLGAEKKKGGKLKPKKKSKLAKANLDPAVNAEASSTDPAQHPENSAIERVTALASTLMAMGELHVYEETHRTLVHSVREAGLVSGDWVPPSAAPTVQPPPPSESLIKYQYRWAPEYLATTTGGAKAGEVFGPYGKDELTAWRGANFFGPMGDRIQLRRLGDETWSDWHIVV
ncbi:hypothetical protein FRB94_014665 [Tulasnella sp. JGI-2019a]|nr:hypothetical protein FRB93_002445 [Tulasnella sp. JGI-2019a]KAG9007097.1 hypothetical protein FRB94_014665 [Tulasnella sp. JGI-2019a]